MNDASRSIAAGKPEWKYLVVWQGKGTWNEKRIETGIKVYWVESLALLQHPTLDEGLAHGEHPDRTPCSTGSLACGLPACQERAGGDRRLD